MKLIFIFLNNMREAWISNSGVSFFYLILYTSVNQTIQGPTIQADGPLKQLLTKVLMYEVNAI